MKEWAERVWRESEWRQVRATLAWLRMERRGWRHGSHRSQDRPLHAEPDLHRCSDRPLHAERIRWSWQAGECAAMVLVVGVGFVAAGRREEPHPSRRGLQRRGGGE